MNQTNAIVSTFSVIKATGIITSAMVLHFYG